MKEVTINLKGDVAEVMLYDVIGEDPWYGGVSAKTFREQIKAVKAKTINLRINSPGGSATEGAAMLAALDEFPGRIEVDVDGLAASAATHVMMAGDKIRIGSNALVMIHQAWGGTIGRASDLRRAAETLEKVNELQIDAYQRRSKASREELAAMLEAETWFTGQEAVDAGLADEVTGAIAVAAMADPLRLAAKLGFKHVPEPPKPACISKEEHAKRAARLAEVMAGIPA